MDERLDLGDLLYAAAVFTVPLVFPVAAIWAAS
jgi:hypothetical protein